MYRGIAISGKQGSGKTTLVKAIQDELGKLNIESYVVSFAEPVKTLTKAVLVSLGIVDESAQEEQWKYRFRHVAQAVGSHLRGYDELTWIKLAQARIQKFAPGTVVLNDDARYPNEVEALKDAGFYVVRLDVDRELRLQRLGNLKNEDHVSETALDKYEGFHSTLLQVHWDNPPTPEAYARYILERAGIPSRPSISFDAVRQEASQASSEDDGDSRHLGDEWEEPHDEKDSITRR